RPGRRQLGRHRPGSGERAEYGTTGGAMTRTNGRTRERGSMTVIMLCVIAGALALALLTAALVRAQTARGHAQGAADLAALAAAEVAALGGTDACSTAQTVTVRNEARMQACTVGAGGIDRKSTRLNPVTFRSRMPSSAS